VSVAYAAALQASGLDDLRYRIPFFPFWIGALAWSLSELWAAGWRKTSTALLALPLTLGIIGSCCLSTWSQRGRACALKGYSYLYCPIAFEDGAEHFLAYSKAVRPGLSAEDAGDLDTETRFIARSSETAAPRNDGLPE
jgi:hypothetical protein